MSDTTEGRQGPSGITVVVWLLIVALGAPALALAGYAWVAIVKPADAMGWADVAVRTIKVLLLSDVYYDTNYVPSSAPGAPHPAMFTPEWMLIVARSLGVAAVLLFGWRVIFNALRQAAAREGVRWRRGHDVVIGDGVAARAYIAQQPQRMITHLSSLDPMRTAKHARVTRSGPLRRQLLAAGAYRAKRILVDEETYSQTLETATEIANEPRIREVLAYISDATMAERFNLLSDRIRSFSYAPGVARKVMLSHPPYLLAHQMGLPKQHIVMFGFGSVGQALVREFLVTSLVGDLSNLMITVVDLAIDERRNSFLRRFPGLPSFVDIAYVNADATSPSVLQHPELVARYQLMSVCAVYLALSETSLPLPVAMDFASEFGRLDREAQASPSPPAWRRNAPIFVCTQNRAGLPKVRDGAGRVGALGQAKPQDHKLLEERQVVPFGEWTEALDGASMLEDSADEQARAYHTHYLNNLPIEQRGSGAGVPWAQLPEPYRISNRRTVAHIRAKLFATGYPLGDWLESRKISRTHDLPADGGEALDRLNPEQKEKLARIEHDRWVVDRVLSGWRHGPVRDNAALIHPLLIAYENLSEAERDKDRANIKTTIEILKSAMGKQKR